MKRRRGLTPEERSLWAAVAASIRPLPGRKAIAPEAEPAPEPEKPAAGASRNALSTSVSIPKPVPRLTPLAPLEEKLSRSLRRGGAVDARIDLHGFRQDEAHSRLVRFLRSQQALGARVVLVITGKGRTESPMDGMFGDGRGVLRRMVPLWLEEPGLRNLVVGFSEASAAHGGSGALYVRLRRADRA